MREIPEDIAEQARQAWNKVMNNSYRDGRILIAHAILAERERCAKIALEWGGSKHLENAIRRR